MYSAVPVEKNRSPLYLTCHPPIYRLDRIIGATVLFVNRASYASRRWRSVRQASPPRGRPRGVARGKTSLRSLTEPLEKSYHPLAHTPYMLDPVAAVPSPFAAAAIALFKSPLQQRPPPPHLCTLVATPTSRAIATISHRRHCCCTPLTLCFG